MTPRHLPLGPPALCGWWSPELAIPLIGLWLCLLDDKRAVLGGALSEEGNLLNWLGNISSPGSGVRGGMRLRA